MFFSVSMPIYNAEKYLDASIPSVVHQTEKDFELILIDDGSKDKSLEICRSWQNRYPDFIRVIEKENSGSLLTRRRCLTESKGDFLYIMDADDYLVDSNTLKKIKNAIIENRADLVFFAYKDEKKEYHQTFADKQTFEGSDKNELYLLLMTTGRLNRLWDKVFSRNLVDWDEDYSKYSNVKVSTDIFQTIPLVANSQKAMYLDDVFYYYRTTAGSIVHSFNPFLFESQKAHNERLREYSESWNLENKDVLLANRLIACACTAVNKTRKVKTTGNISRKEYIKSIGEDADFIKALSVGNIHEISPFKKKTVAYFLKYRMYGILDFIMYLLP